MAVNDLPLADSPTVRLVVATPEEHRETWHFNSAEWKGPLSLEAYLRREEYLLDQDLTRDGGLTPWILVHQPQPDGPRKILCACETLKKRAFVATDGKSEEGICHGVASVFCPAEHRGKGYAAKMIAELAKMVKHWQQEDSRVLFSILFSDIGKRFYAVHDWQPFDSYHISLSPAASELRPSTSYLTAEDISSLCDADEALVLEQVKDASKGGVAVAIIPDTRTVRWHQARADFFAQELLGKQPQNRGALIKLADGRRAWCYWQHNWSKVEKDKDNKLYILHLVVTGDATSDVEQQEQQQQLELLEPLLAAAQAEAASWGLQSVELWNPSPTITLAAKRLDAGVQEIHRESSSITSLSWFGQGDWRNVRWICNERYGWC